MEILMEVEVVPETLMVVGARAFLEAVVGIQSSLAVEVVPETLMAVGAREFLEAALGSLSSLAVEVVPKTLMVVVVEIQSSVVVEEEEHPSRCGLVQHTWCRWSWCL